MRFVAMAHAEFGRTDRQIAIAFDPLLENLYMAGTIHRLETDQLRLALTLARRDRNLEHVVAIYVPMAGGFENTAVDQLRRQHFDITGALQTAAHIIFDHAVKRPAFRM